MPLNWEFWLDNHLSPIMAKWLSDEKGWIVKSTYILKLNGLSDFEIYSKAKEYGNVIIITKDSDIPAIVTIHGAPPKVIVLNMGNMGNRILFNIIKTNIDNAVKMLLDFKKDIVEID
jgi:predicted nuclease of predicted toxin-antitoxin system